MLSSRTTSILTAIGGCVFAALLYHYFLRDLVRPFFREDPVSLISRSLDGRTEVRVREYRSFIDRNFLLEVVDLRTGTKRVIFNSPDEGQPGTERIVWSNDSNRFVLLGRTFFVETNAHLPNGERLYLLYDLNSGRLRCNAIQQIQYENFTTNEIAGIKLD